MDDFKHGCSVIAVKIRAPQCFPMAICIRQFSVREKFGLNKNMDNPLEFVLMGSYCQKC